MASVINVGLVQINNSFSNQNYLPLSVGMLQAYAQSHLKRPESYRFLLPIYKRIAPDNAVDSLLEADIVFFSVYVWNIRISLEIARRLKTQKPEVIVAFGGPQVPDRDDTFLRTNSFIDIACHGEGERVGAAILEHYTSRNWTQIPSLSFLTDDGELVRTPSSTRTKDLSLFPSPYVEGIFEPLMRANPYEQWIALWETNRGCPFSCTFCDWGSAIASKVYAFDLERLYQEVEWFAKHRIEFVFCCDANFGILPRDIDIVQFVAETKKRVAYPKALSVQATKNATERAYQAQKVLADAGLNKGIDIALQSIDPLTLKSIKRDNISTETYQELQRRFSRDNIETYTDLIIGLPNETYDSFADAVSTIVSNGQHNRIQFNNLSILPNAEMGDPEYQRKYGMITIESRTINIHGALSESERDIYEMQMLVVGTKSMPKPDWVRTRAFSWMAALLHFDKILQIPFVIVHDICRVSYRQLIEIFSESVRDPYPVLSSVRSFLLERARDIQNGGPEYCLSKHWLPIWWPTDEYVLIRLCFEDCLECFYIEAENILQEYLDRSSLSMPSKLLHESVELNRMLLKRPFQKENAECIVSFNVWEYYQAAIRGSRIPLESKPTVYHIDRTTHRWESWDDWCREVIWYGNKKGAYLYGSEPVERQLSGHF